MTTVLLVVAATWGLAALVALLSRSGRPAAVFGALAVLHAAAAVWAPAAALLPAAWLGYALTAPGGRAGSTVRRVLPAVAALAGLAWAWVCAAQGRAPDGGALVVAALVTAGLGVAGLALRCRRAGRVARLSLQWTAAGGVLAAGFALVVLALHVLVGAPDDLAPWLVASLALIPLAEAFATAPATVSGGETALSSRSSSPGSRAWSSRCTSSSSWAWTGLRRRASAASSSPASSRRWWSRSSSCPPGSGCWPSRPRSWGGGRSPPRRPSPRSGRG